MFDELQKSLHHALLQDFQEIANKEEVQAYLQKLFEKHEHLDEMLECFEDAIPHLVNGDLHYAQSWIRASKMHEDHGTYRRMVKFMKVPKDSLIIEFGVGSGGLLVELARQGYTRLLGIDLNPFLLHYTTHRLQEIIPQTTLEERVTISYNPDLGFILRGTPLMKKIDLQFPHIIAGDFMILHNIIRALYFNGVKADVCVSMLQGGQQTKPIAFLKALFPEQYMEYDSPEYRIEQMNRSISMIIKPGGLMIHGLRTIKMNDQQEVVEVSRKEQQKFYQGIEEARKSNLTVVDTVQVELPEEKNHIGLTTNAPIEESDIGQYQCDFIKYQLPQNQMKNHSEDVSHTQKKTKGKKRRKKRK